MVGHATVEGAPDYAAVRIGVVTRAPGAAAALDANSAAATRIIDLAKGMGVEPNDLSTGAVTLNQAFRNVRDGNGSSQQPDGYEATNLVLVRLADMAKLGELMRRSLDGGANRIDNVSFGLRDPRMLGHRAESEAVADAIARAKTLAAAAGVSLGSIERISPPRSGGQVMPFETRLALAAPAPPRSVPLAAGTVSLTAEIEVVWVLKQP